MVAVIANAAALYSASALDKAMGTGTKDAPSTKLPNTYTTNAPVLLEVSTQSCQDESVKSKIGWSSGSNCGGTCLPMSRLVGGHQESRTLGQSWFCEFGHGGLGE